MDGTPESTERSRRRRLLARLDDGRQRLQAIFESSRPFAVGLALLATLIALLLLTPFAWLLREAGALGFEEITAFVSSANTLDIIVNSVVLTATVTGCSILIGVPLAVLTVQTDLPFRRFWTVVAALPLVIPSYIGAFAFVSAFGPRGVLQDILAPLGVEQLPEIYGLLGATLVLTLYTYPYVYLTTRASLLAFDGTVVEAARTLNHTRWEAFRRVTLPQIKPGIAAGSLLVALYTLSDFGTPQIMRYDVFTRMIYVWYDNFALGRAAVLSLLLLVLTVVILRLESRISASNEGAYVSSGDRDPSRISLGYWKWPAVGFCALIAGLGLALPIGILVMWLRRPSPGYAAGGFEFEFGYVLNSMSVSLAAAIISVVVGLPLAYLSARGDSRLASLPERASYIGYATPGIVVGLALISFGLRVALYKTVVILVFAYVIRFVPQAIGTMKSSILQVDPKYVEAARSMGDSPLRSFRRVVLPQITPGLVAGGALVFLTTMKELPATLILAPIGSQTVVTYIWQVQEAAYYGQAAVPALLLVCVSALSMVVILRQDGYDGT
ncbi:ABC transporter permease subunit [Halovenus sp. WSH3]|uniref:ABC transporter permease subunit n=1 Tax=Halovenus carboxidivorans TaxID=2692199 RepID=A0A6B0T5I7_9EURY|nr:iron ABC transporter permease [Halovenus carboxidivorans]MXR50491.1 ABC transporter permease subunit [Halovenus carboxidivorans]